MSEAPGDFWNWSLEVYDRPSVADDLIELQDKFGLDVNLILWSCWAGLRHGPLPELAMRKAVDISRQWSGAVVEHLREARRALKSPPRQADPDAAEALREHVRAAELEAERLQQAMLETLAQSEATDAAASPSEGAARQNLASYVGLCGVARKPGFSIGRLISVLEKVGPQP
ncbi:MAG: TIGR02444 family protein [Pseudomonadota bacterium]